VGLGHGTQKVKSFARLIANVPSKYAQVPRNWIATYSWLDDKRRALLIVTHHGHRGRSLMSHIALPGLCSAPVS